MPSATNGTTYVWKTWVSDGNSTSATYSASSGEVWNIWCDSATVTSTTSATVVWNTWNEQHVYGFNEKDVFLYKPQPETEESKQARLRAEEERRISEEARKKTAAEAKEKAERLLLEHLNPVQLRQLKEMDAFIVQLETRRYKVRRNHRVQELDKKDKPIAEYCIVPNESFLPQADVMLSKKLMLEHDEESFLRIANRTPMVQ